MRHTLVAAFDTLKEAQAAKSQLMTKNIREVDISASELNNDPSSTTRSTTADRSGDQDESFGDKVSDFFASLFGEDENHRPHHHGTAYPEAYRRGAALVTVKAANDDQAEEVEAILERNGAIDIDERSATWNTDGASKHVAGKHIGAGDKSGATDRSVDHSGERASIPVIDEDLKVGKRQVNKGTVRVVSRVTEHPVEENVRLHEEHAHVERRPVDRAANPEELKNFKSGSLEIQETEEEAVVEKRARVVEEVVVGKESSDREKTIRDTVRHTDVDVQNDATRRDATLDKTNKPNDRFKS
ncbi:YsnF/AvaK domain-containing protein [Halopseudomonas nanhaiensis]|uniref:YsnF/AvaK domain-containing protein n=1 Tax=Halopseudomonas nanhaiensis TaxID=2830842 RepID=UPI001CBC3D19|nr:YsnF/AvaK domain-containing protein [Halopseudomonas nanhaiensis]UAW97223.1 YsnF/AvaK domain-containing protein [Halopseudomonas nanhaiensis]